MTRMIVAALAALCLAAPVASQNITIGNTGPDMAEVLKKPIPKTQKQWWPMWREMIGKLRSPIVGDAVEPELGVNLDKAPAIVASNFPTGPLLVPAWGTGALPGSSAGEGVGAFRFFCGAGQVLRDDPIVFPGQPGKSHLHQFFGNKAANAHSTYASLRAAGDSTCVNPLNRSAYWMPAMLDGKGNVIRIDYVSIYYKRQPAGSQDCATIASECQGVPRGLRFIFGYDMVGGGQPTGSGTWGCDGPVKVAGSFRSLAEVRKVCPVGNRIFFTLGAPNCWNGKNLDSPDHRSHLAYAGYGDTGKYRCPKTHPVLIPAFSLEAFWYVSEMPTDPASDWSLSSDDMTAMGHGKMPPGSTFHADFMDAWDNTVEAMWTDNCINKLLSCSGGDLGNGLQMKDTTGFDWVAHPRKVPIPSVIS